MRALLSPSTASFQLSTLFPRGTVRGSRACGSHCSCGQSFSSACGLTGSSESFCEPIRCGPSRCARSLRLGGAQVRTAIIATLPHLGRETAHRVSEPVAAYLASGLRPTSSGFVFTAMLPGGYRVLDQAGRDVWIAGKQPMPVDELSFAGVRTRIFSFWNSRTALARAIVAVSNRLGLEDSIAVFRC